MAIRIPKGEFCLLSVFALSFTSAFAGFYSFPLHAKESCDDLVTIHFEEGAPVDTFMIRNRSENLAISAVHIDLSRSSGRLIFDTTSGGDGVDVFQPYKTVSGSAKIAEPVSVGDGAQQISIRFESFPAGSDYTFSIDVDDQLTASELGQTRISGGEMEGAVANLDLVGDNEVSRRVTARFGKSNVARLKHDDCQDGS